MLSQFNHSSTKHMSELASALAAEDCKKLPFVRQAEQAEGGGCKSSDPERQDGFGIFGMVAD